ncbi:hypothetical protein [Brevundimonas sp. Leaf168]|uniref:hypothetical protein n=1 Tax=Brevundimonas sp. Leaf168 TaxID=1736283 RepID=UPI0006FC743D|nr:hypothetical protein [Brevundimonas sp. Leaf168]KQR57155.1 hypothetical protein ASF81_06270 [Brevundimonas sp. Leaf168]
MDDDHSYDDGGFEGPRDPFYDAMTQQALDQIRILREAGLEQTYRDALHHDSSPEAEAAFWRAHGLPMHLLRLPDLVTSDPAARAADRVQNRGYRRLSKEAWEAAGTAYLAGSTAEEVSAVYGMAVSTFRARARDEGWRREDQPDPLREPIDLEAETADGLPDYGAMAAHALVRLNRALQAGRALEAARWVRLHADLTRMAAAPPPSPPAPPPAKPPAQPQTQAKEPDLGERAAAVAEQVGQIAREACALKRGDYAGRDALMARLEALDDLKPAPRSDDLDEIDGVFAGAASKAEPPG